MIFLMLFQAFLPHMFSRHPAHLTSSFTGPVVVTMQETLVIAHLELVSLSLEVHNEDDGGNHQQTSHTDHNNTHWGLVERITLLDTMAGRCDFGSVMIDVIGSRKYRWT